MLRRVLGFGLSMLAFVTVSGCTTPDTTANEIASLETEPDVPATITSVADWNQLDKDARLAVLEKDFGKFPNLKLTDKSSPDALSDPQQKAFAEKMTTHMRTNGNMTVGDESHARIGDTKVLTRLLLLDGKTILGGTIQFVQQGCDMPDESVQTFKSKAEAEKANCETAPDAVWTAYGSFNHDGVPIEIGDFMEWGSL